LEIRRALATEAGSLAAVWLRSREASVPWVPPTVRSHEEVLRWFEDVVLPSSDVWVADHHGEPVALMVVDDEWIRQLYVEPTSTGKGIGGALLTRAVRRRPEGLRLWTFQSNRGSRRVYEAHGFVATISTAGDNDEHAPDVSYEWRPAGRR